MSSEKLREVILALGSVDRLLIERAPNSLYLLVGAFVVEA